MSMAYIKTKLSSRQGKLAIAALILANEIRGALMVAGFVAPFLKDYM